MELIGVTGLRGDGRRPREIRRINLELGVMNKNSGAMVDGSANLEIGNTKVLAFVRGPQEPFGGARSEILHDKASLSCSVVFEAFSQTERRRRGPGDKKSQEISNAVVDILQGFVQLKLFPKCEIAVSIHVLQADGGVLPACVNATILALVDAGIPMDDFVVCSQAGHIDSTNLVDLNSSEESSTGPSVWLVFSPRSRTILSMNMVGKAPYNVVEELIKMAVYGCEQISYIIEPYVRFRTEKMILSAISNSN